MTLKGLEKDTGLSYATLYYQIMKKGVVPHKIEDGVVIVSEKYVEILKNKLGIDNNKYITISKLADMLELTKLEMQSMIKSHNVEMVKIRNRYCITNEEASRISDIDLSFNNIGKYDISDDEKFQFRSALLFTKESCIFPNYFNSDGYSSIINRIKKMDLEYHFSKKSLLKRKEKMFCIVLSPKGFFQINSYRKRILKK